MIGFGSVIQGLLFLLLAPFAGVYYARCAGPWFDARPGWSRDRSTLTFFAGGLVMCGALRLGIWALFW